MNAVIVVLIIADFGIFCNPQGIVTDTVPPTAPISFQRQRFIAWIKLISFARVIIQNIAGFLHVEIPDNN